MEVLVLLCNLYADGPHTLRRLHKSGVRSLEELERAPIGHLTDVLGSTPASARRLQREARLWRVGAGASALGNAQAAAHEARGITADSSAASERARTSPTAARPAERGSDGRDPAAALVRVPARRIPALPLDEIAPTRALPSTKIAPVAARQTERASATLLRGGLLPGLDSSACPRLIGEGIRTLAQLACAPAARLAPLIGRPLAEVEQWRAQAQELLAGSTRALRTRDASEDVDHAERHVEDVESESARRRDERQVEIVPAPRVRPPAAVWSSAPAARIDKGVVRQSVRPRAVALDDAAGPFA